MAKRIWWFIPIVVLVVLTANVGLTVPIRIAFAAFAVVMLVDIIMAIRRFDNDRGKKED